MSCAHHAGTQKGKDAVRHTSADTMALGGAPHHFAVHAAHSGGVTLFRVAHFTHAQLVYRPARRSHDSVEQRQVLCEGLHAAA